VDPTIGCAPWHLSRPMLRTSVSTSSLTRNTGSSSLLTTISRLTAAATQFALSLTSPVSLCFGRSVSCYQNHEMLCVCVLSAASPLRSPPYPGQMISTTARPDSVALVVEGCVRFTCCVSDPSTSVHGLILLVMLVWSRGNINTAALVTVVLCNTLVARCSRQLIGPAVIFCHTRILTL